MLPGHVTFRNLSRYSPYHEKTFARHFATSVDFVSLNKAAITQVVPPDHEQALVLDASFGHCQVNGQNCRTGLLGGTLRSFRDHFITPSETPKPQNRTKYPQSGRYFIAHQ